MGERKRAFVTGASEGIGRAFAIRLSAEGYDVTAVARNKERLESLRGELTAGAHLSLAKDLSTTEGVQAVAEELGGKRYDLLINNAGFGINKPFYQSDLAKCQTMIRVNVDAVVILAHAFLKNARAGDALINVSSALAFLPYPRAGVYAATKAFVTSFSEALWYEQKSRGIYVMGLCPGVTSTNFHRRSGGTEADLPPQSITQSPEEVVQTAMNALRKRSKPSVISGSKNIMMTAMSRLMSRKILVGMMGKNA